MSFAVVPPQAELLLCYLFFHRLFYIPLYDRTIDTDGANKISLLLINLVDSPKVWGLRPHAPPLTMSVV